MQIDSEWGWCIPVFCPLWSLSGDRSASLPRAPSWTPPPETWTRPSLSSPAAPVTEQRSPSPDFRSAPGTSPAPASDSPAPWPPCPTGIHTDVQLLWLSLHEIRVCSWFNSLFRKHLTAVMPFISHAGLTSEPKIGSEDNSVSAQDLQALPSLKPESHTAGWFLQTLFSSGKQSQTGLQTDYRSAVAAVCLTSWTTHT